MTMWTCVASLAIEEASGPFKDIYRKADQSLSSHGGHYREEEIQMLKCTFIEYRSIEKC